MSKQANQRYRKEKEKELLKKDTITGSTTDKTKDINDSKKYNNNTYNTEG